MTAVAEKAHDDAVANERGASTRLEEASDGVAARRAWLDEVDADPLDRRVWVHGRVVGGAGSIFLGSELTRD